MLRTRHLSAVSLCLVIASLFALSACNDPSLGQTKQPWAHTDVYMVDQGSVLTVPAATGVLDNDEGKGLTCDAGTITTNQGGTVILVGDGGFTYTPLGLFAGVDVFAYKVHNDGGYDIGSVQITVNPVLPFAIDDSYATTLNTALNVPAGTGVLFNDTLNGATITAPALAPTVVTTTQGGSLLLNADGSFDYTPLAAFTGNDTFTYTLTNPQGTDNGTVTIAVRQAPTAVNDPGYVTSPGTLMTVPDGATDLLANDTLGFPAATLTSFGGGSAGGTVTTNTAGNTLVLGTGSLTVNANGSFSFTPDTGFGGNFTFNYRLTNAAGTSDGLVTVNVDPAPNAVDDPSLTATSTVLLSVAAPGLMSNDALGLPAATIVSFGGGSMGGAVTDNVAGTPVALGTGSITVNANGSVSFTSNTGFTGNFTFDYRLQNVAGSSDATVTILVQLGPTAVADSYTTSINTPFSRATTDADDLLDNDMGVPSPTIASFGGGSAGGTVTSNLAGATATFGAGSLIVAANGSFTFTPDTGFTGNFTFQYRAQNAVGTSDATVTIAVTQAPTAVPDPSYIATSTVALIVPVGTGLLANNALGFPAATVVNFGAGDLGGVVTDNAAGATVTLGTGSLIVRADGSFDFTSNTGFRGNFTFQYRIQNSIGFSDSAVTIEVRLAPGAVADSYATPPGVPLSVSAGTGVLSNDERGFPLATVTSFGGGSLGGTVTSNAAGATITPLPTFADGSITLNADGSISFTPATGQLGAFTFSYRATNVLGTSDGGVTIQVSQVPTAVNDGTYTTPISTTLSVPTGTGLLSNDTLGVPAATLTSFGGGSLGGAVTSNTAGSGVAMAGGTLTVNADGSFSLTTPTIIGAYTFMYRLTNIAGSSDAIVTLEVHQGPTAAADPTGGIPGTSTPGSTPFHIVINGSIASGTSPVLTGNDALGFPTATVTSFGPTTGLETTVASTSNGTTVAGGIVRVFANGTFNYSPINATFTGLDSFRYTITNSIGSSTAIVSLAVGIRPAATNDTYAPIIVGNVAINTAASTNFSVLTNDTGDQRVAALVSATNGTATVNANGTFTFNPNAGFEGAATITYSVTNGFGAAGTNGVVNLTVTGMIWFIDNNAGAAGDGRLGTPFNTLAGFVAGAADDPGDNIFVFRQTATNYSGGITLLNNQRLIGQGATATLTAITSLTPPADSAALPNTSGTNPVIDGGVVLGSGNLLRGFNGGSGGTAAISGSGFGTVTVAEVSINTTGMALALTNGTVSGTFASVTSTGGLNNLSLITISGTWTITAGTLSGPTAECVFVNGGAMNLTLGATITGGATGAAVSVSGGTSTIIFGGTMTQANNQALLSVAGGHATGTLTFNAALSATSGTGLQFNNADGTYTFNGAVTLNGGDAGVDILAGSSGAITFNNATSAITNPSGIGFQILNSSPTSMTYAGTINHNSANGAVSLSTIASGTIAFSGTITCTGSSQGIGIGGVSGATAVTISGNLAFTGAVNAFVNINSNTGGTINFSGASKALNTSSGPAVSLMTNTGVAINFTGGGLVINTSSGTGFLATGGGLVTVTGAGNTITSTTGTCFDMQNTSAGASGVTFASCVSGTGQVAGIINSTGTKTLGRINTSSGGVTAVNLDNAGTVNVGSTNATRSAVTTSNAEAVRLTATTLSLDGTGSNDGLDITVTTIGVGVAVFGTAAIGISGGPLVISCTGTGNGLVGTTAVALTISGTGNSITTNSGTCISLSTGTSTLTFDSCTSTSGAVASITNSTGTKTLGRIQTSSGGTTALTLTNAGAVNVGAVAASIITTTTATCLSIEDTTLNLSGAGLDINSASGSGVLKSGTGTVAITGGGLDISTTSGTGLNATTGGTISLSGVGINTITTTTGTALLITGTTIGGANITLASITCSTASANPGVNLQNTGAGTLGITGTTSINGRTASSLFVGGTVNAAFGVVNITNRGNFGIEKDGGAGALSFGVTTISGATANAAIRVANTTGGTVTFVSTDIPAGATGIGIQIAVCAGSFTSSGGTITDPAGTAFSVTSGTGNITFSGNISDNSGFAIDINNHGTGTITFQTGTLSATGTGIRVQNHASGTVNFNQPTKTISTGASTGVDMGTGISGGTINFGNGGLAITTTSGTGFLAAGAAASTVTVGTGTNPNTISSGTGTALNINGTTIGAANVTFFSISANGGANGIVLNNTGTSGGLTVTGTGTTAGSGGTIQNISTRGGNFTTAVNIRLSNMTFTNACTSDFPAGPTGLSLGNNTADNAVLHFQSVTNVVLDNVNITGSAEQGINGHFVTNFSLLNSALLNCGSGPDEDGIHFFNMLGACQITNTNVTSSGDDNFNIQNNTNLSFPSGMIAVSDIAFSGGSANTGVQGSGYLFGIRGTSVCSIAISGVTSNNNFSGGIVADCFDTATMCLDVGNSSSTNNNDAISLSCNNGNVNFDIHDNVSFAGTDFGVINILKAAFSTAGSLEGRVHNNPIVVADGRPADGLFVFQAGAGAIRVAVTNNTFTYRGTQRAMVFQGGQDGGGSLQATVTGNNIDMQLDGTGNAVAGVLAQAAITSPSGDGASINLDFGGAGALRNIFTHSLGGTMAAGDIRVRQRLNGTYNLSGYGGAATDTAAVIAYLTARNTVVSPPTATADSVGFTGTTTPAFVSVSVSPASVIENSGTNLVFTLTRTGSTAAGLLVNFSIYGIASFNGTVDFSVSGGGVTFNTGTGAGTANFGAGNATITITISISFDATVEPDEAMIVDVGGGSSGRGVITNDD